MTVRPAPMASRPVGNGTASAAGFCFWGYLVLLTLATHYPRVDVAYLENVGRWSPLQPDKAVHLVAYAILGALAGAAFARGRPAAVVVRLFVALACWGFIDESTQPLFGRSAEFWDWCHDIVGLAIGLAVAVVVVRHRESRARRPGLGRTAA